MASYSLTYFPSRGRRELIRYIFKTAEKDFEDIRIPYAEWKALKPSTPFGQVPFLEVDGKKLAQSVTIARFLANEFGLGGRTNWERAEIDQIVDLLEDMRKERIKAVFENDPEKKADMEKKLAEETYPKFVEFFEKLLEANGGKYFVGKSLTLADLAILEAFDTPTQNHPDLLRKFTKMASHRQMMLEHPNLQEYIKNRKVTPY